jgi:hypothetical protein
MNPNKWVFNQMEIKILISINEVHLNDHVPNLPYLHVWF